MRGQRRPVAVVPMQIGAELLTTGGAGERAGAGVADRRVERRGATEAGVGARVSAAMVGRWWWSSGWWLVGGEGRGGGCKRTVGAALEGGAGGRVGDGEVFHAGVCGLRGRVSG